MKKFFIIASILVLIGVFFFFMASFFQREGAKTGSNKPVTLLYYRFGENPKMLTSQISAYQKKHPNVKVLVKDFYNLAAYEDRLINEMAEGRGPDLFSMPNSWIYKHVRKINPVPLDMMTAENFRKTFVDVADRDFIRPDQNGYLRIFGIPFFVDSLGVYYNKDHYEDRLPASGRPSETWTGLKNDVFQLTKVESGAIKVAGAALGRTDNITLGVDILYAIFLQLNTKMYDKGDTVAIFSTQQKGSNSEDNTPGVDALNLYTSFAKSSGKSYSWDDVLADVSSGENEIDAFVQGKVSMIFGYSDTYKKILDAIELYKGRKMSVINKLIVRTSPFPQFFDPESSTQKRTTLARYFAETVSRNSKFSREAWDLLIFLSGKENLAAYFQTTHRPASRRDLIEEQKKDPLYGVFSSQSAYGVSMPVYDENKSSDIFSNAVFQVVHDGVTPVVSLKNAENEFSRILPEEGFFGPGPYIETGKK